MIVAAVLLPSAPAQPPSLNLAGASLEDLLKVEVTSVSKKEQTLSRTGASIFVISHEDIRHSGATNIPDLLRMAPGVEVAQLQAGGWAISIRGFNAVYANKVLVLVDGRTVYQDTFSGVFWDQLGLPLEDIDRIEVIRGPGGTVWGANAVSGVINILTRSAAETKGGLLVAGGGNNERGSALLRYGGNLGSAGAYRVFGRYSNLADSRLPGGSRSPDGGSLSDFGFRIDEAPGMQDSLTFEGGAHFTRLGTTDTVVTTSPLAQFQVNNPLTDNSGSVLGRWTHASASGSTYSIQAYDNILHRQEVAVGIADNTFDFELEHHFRAGDRNDIVWGFDYRRNADRVTPEASYALRYANASRTDTLYAAFIQDEFALSNALYLTVGSKFEYNTFTTFEWEPGAQLVWVVNARNSFWASASQAVRQPDRSDFELDFNAAVTNIPGLGSSLITVNGNPRIGSEHLLDFEVGYRAQPEQRISIDLTAFASYYRSLETVETGSPEVRSDTGQSLFVIPEYFDNRGRGRNLGVEAFANWSAARKWKLSPGVSVEKLRTLPDSGSTDTTLRLIAGNSPRYQPQIRSSLPLRRNTELDGTFKYVSSLTSQKIPGYTRLDVRFGWRPTETLELSVVGQNLTSGSHIEFSDNSGYYVTARVRTGLLCRLTWKF